MKEEERVSKNHYECDVLVIAQLPELHKAHVYCKDHDIAFATEYWELLGEKD